MDTKTTPTVCEADHWPLLGFFVETDCDDIDFLNFSFRVIGCDLKLVREGGKHVLESRGSRRWTMAYLP